jgi:hypothetical protein
MSVIWYDRAVRDRTIELATRNAPAWARRQIMDELHGKAEKRSRPKPSGHIVLVGACCPGRSSPVTAGTDGLRLPEVIAPDAFAHSLRCVKARAVTVNLEAGHCGEAIASTADGTLDITASKHTGPMVVARVKVSRLNSEMLAAAMAGRMTLSVSMLPRRIEIVTRNGRRVRHICEAELHSVAALWDAADHGQACYPAARIHAAFEDDKRAVRQAMRRAAAMAECAMLKAGWA